MNNPGRHSRVSQSRNFAQTSSSYLDDISTSIEEQLQNPGRHHSEPPLLTMMSSNQFDFAIPPDLSPSPNFPQANNSPSSLLHSVSHFASPVEQAACFDFGLAQPSTVHSSPIDQFSVKNFPQQQQIQHYQQQYLHSQYQHRSQQQPKQPKPYGAIRRSSSVASMPRRHPLHQEQRPPILTVQNPSPSSASACLQTDQQHYPQQPFEKQDYPTELQQSHETEPAAKQQAQSKDPKHHGIPSKRPHDPWTLRGSCACCHVQYEMTAAPSELPLQARYCHCAVCRNLSGSNYVAYASMPDARLRWFAGQWDWNTGRAHDITATVTAARHDLHGYRHHPHQQHSGKTTSSSTGSGSGCFATAADSIRLWRSSRRAVRGSCAKCGSVLFVSYRQEQQQQQHHRHKTVGSGGSINEGGVATSGSGGSGGSSSSNGGSSVVTTSYEGVDKGDNEEGDESTATATTVEGVSPTIDVALGTLWNVEERGHMLVRPAMHTMLREKALWDPVPADDGLLRFDGHQIQLFSGGGGGVSGDGDSDGTGAGSQPKLLLPHPPPAAGTALRTKDTPLMNLRHLLKCLLVY